MTSPLNVFAYISDPDEYIKRISSLKIYENINLDSVIRGNKQKEILLPTKYTLPVDETQNFTKQGSIIGQKAVIGEGTKIRRSIIEEGCKIGKDVDIINSVIMSGVHIKDKYFYFLN
jgi:NDP-sugar pyrophosphorylase family protein